MESILKDVWLVVASVIDHWQQVTELALLIAALAWKVKTQLVGKKAVVKVAQTLPSEVHMLLDKPAQAEQETPVDNLIAHAVQTIDPDIDTPKKTIAEQIYEKFPILGKAE